jgi:predicted nucleic acid-binding protein
VGQVLLDSRVLIDVLRGHTRALDFLVGLEETPLVAAVTIGELFSGAHRPGEEARITELSLQLKLVPADFAVARLGGTFRRQYDASHGVTLIHALIAASARLCRVPLATRNARHFPMLDDVMVPYRLN